MIQDSISMLALIMGMIGIVWICFLFLLGLFVKAMIETIREWDRADYITLVICTIACVSITLSVLKIVANWTLIFKSFS